MLQNEELFTIKMKIKMEVLFLTLLNFLPNILKVLILASKSTFLMHQYIFSSHWTYNFIVLINV